MDASDTPEMEKLAGEYFALEYDRANRGIWIDVAELNRVLLHNNLPGLERMGGKVDPDAQTGTCPTDQVDLVGIAGGKRGSVLYETCEVCGGVWITAEREIDSAKDAEAEIVDFFKAFAEH